ncbi:MAG: ComF family protein [Gillisia sp.]
MLLKNEEVICTTCLHDLPLTNFHFHNENPVKKVFYGRFPIENATSLLQFHKKSSVQKLIHQLKYRGRREISTYLGKWMGEELTKSPFFKNIDVVIPVPLHKKKLKSRGFNQVEGFGREISKLLKVPYNDAALQKTSFSTTQTLKARLARWGNIEETFVLRHPEDLQDKHILLVDDLITTGATMEACANELLKSPGVKISIASMAVA